MRYVPGRQLSTENSHLVGSVSVGLFRVRDRVALLPQLRLRLAQRGLQLGGAPRLGSGGGARGGQRVERRRRVGRRPIQPLLCSMKIHKDKVE